MVPAATSAPTIRAINGPDSNRLRRFLFDLFALLRTSDCASVDLLSATHSSLRIDNLELVETLQRITAQILGHFDKGLQVDAKLLPGLDRSRAPGD